VLYRIILHSIVINFVFIGAVNAKNEIYFTPSLKCEELVIRQIKRAKKSIDVAIYSLTNKKISSMLESKHEKIPVRIIADRMQARNKSSMVPILKQTIPVRLSKKHKIEHNKFIILDDVKVVTGSYNYTTNANKYNSENCIFIRDKEQLYKKRFNYLWKLYK